MIFVKSFELKIAKIYLFHITFNLLFFIVTIPNFWKIPPGTFSEETFHEDSLTRRKFGKDEIVTEHLVDPPDSLP